MGQILPVRDNTEDPRGLNIQVLKSPLPRLGRYQILGSYMPSCTFCLNCRRLGISVKFLKFRQKKLNVKWTSIRKTTHGSRSFQAKINKQKGLNKLILKTIRTKDIGSENLLTLINSFNYLQIYEKYLQIN